MRSIGIDNIGLATTPSGTEWNEIKRQCQYKDPKTGAYAFIPDKIFFEPKGTFIRCNINVPKLAYGHNVTLAQPEDIKIALEKCKQLLPVPLNLRNALVQTIHVAYTQDSPYPFNLSRNILVVPKRPKFDLYDEASGTYLNGDRMRFVFYDTTAKLKANKEVLSQEIASQCDHRNIIRAELRLDRAVIRQLKEQGLWTFNSLLCSDLCTVEGFLALVRFYQWRAPQFVIGWKKKESKEFSEEEKSTLSLSEELLRLYKRKCKSGKISETDLSRKSNEILALQKKECAKELLSGIGAECNRVYERYNMQTVITGKVVNEELIYARS